jgi:hypothetical protein
MAIGREPRTVLLASAAAASLLPGARDRCNTHTALVRDGTKLYRAGCAAPRNASIRNGAAQVNSHGIDNRRAPGPAAVSPGIRDSEPEPC